MCLFGVEVVGVFIQLQVSIDSDWLVRPVAFFVRGCILFGGQVDYLNALGRLEDPHTVIATDNKGNVRKPS